MFSSVFCFLLKIHCPPVFSVFSLFLLLSSQTSLLEALSTLKFCFLPLLSPSLRGVLFSAFCILLPPLGWASFWILVSVFCFLQHSGGPRGAACASVFCFLLSGLSLVSKRQQNPETFSGQASPPPPNVSCFLVFAPQTLSHEIISANRLKRLHGTLFSSRRFCPEYNPICLEAPLENPCCTEGL